MFKLSPFPLVLLSPLPSRVIVTHRFICLSPMPLHNVGCRVLRDKKVTFIAEVKNVKDRTYERIDSVLFPS